MGIRRGRDTATVKQPLAASVGGYDRTHDGLVSGWFVCALCRSSASPMPDLVIQGRLVESTASRTVRGDVPGGQGYLFRFPPTGIHQPSVRVQCPQHGREGLDILPSPEVWSTPAVAVIESSDWPLVSGWVALIAAHEGDIRMVVDGYPPVSVFTTVRRTDVEAYLGDHGVAGFSVDLGAVLGYALPDGTCVRLITGTRILADAFVADSPLATGSTDCLSASLAPGVARLDESALVALRQRLINADVNTQCGWRSILAQLGLHTDDVEVDNWAVELSRRGLTDKQIAAWLAIREAAALGVPVMNPLPRGLDGTIDIDDVALPERVREWARSILGIRGRVAARKGVALTEANRPTGRSGRIDDLKFAVAGLVHHKSGLGQNSRNSLKALSHAGIHACSAPFFPSSGGWNPSLGPHAGTLGVLKDHRVLLHLPIDQVRSSLAAQPALLQAERLIGYFMWETEAVPLQYRQALALVDEIWTGSEFVAESLRSEFSGQVRVVGHVVDTSAVESLPRLSFGVDDEDFVVHFAFDAHSSVSRKNPTAAVRAFVQAFGDDQTAKFVIKVRNFEHLLWQARRGNADAQDFLRSLASCPSARLLTGEESKARTLGIMAAADCYLSLHRAEGFGYGVAEALSLGVPVVATDYSGVRDFLDESCGWPIPYVEVPVYPGQYIDWAASMHWAEADIEAAAAALRVIRAGGPEVQRRRQAGRQRVKERLSLAAVADSYSEAAGGPQQRGSSRSTSD